MGRELCEQVTEQIMLSGSKPIPELFRMAVPAGSGVFLTPLSLKTLMQKTPSCR